MPIYSFTGPDGAEPVAGVILDGNGNLFGTTVKGGLYGYGTVFELTYNVNYWLDRDCALQLPEPERWTWPYGGLVEDSAGNLYGSDQ